MIKWIHVTKKPSLPRNDLSKYIVTSTRGSWVKFKAQYSPRSTIHSSNQHFRFWQIKWLDYSEQTGRLYYFCRKDLHSLSLSGFLFRVTKIRYYFMEIKPLIFNKLSLEFRRAEFQKKLSPIPLRGLITNYHGTSKTPNC